MSAETKAAKAVTVTSLGIVVLSAGALIAKDALKKREQKENIEYMQQSAGDSGMLFQRETVRLR